MTDQNTPPKLDEQARQIIFEHLGYWGLAFLALIGAGVYVWTHWEKIKTWPGVSRFLAFLKPLPKADPGRFCVAVLNLRGDEKNAESRELILELLREFEGIQVLHFERTITVSGGDREEKERKGHEKARKYLQRSGASIAVWGRVVRQGGVAKPSLYLTAAPTTEGRPSQYGFEDTGKAFRLPEVFWEDLSDVLRLVVTSQNLEFEALDGHYIADHLEPYIERIRILLGNNSRRHLGWDAFARVNIQALFADALRKLGEQTGRNQALQEAISIYREVLKEWTRGHAPLDWAATQNNLGNALQTLGGRECGVERLEEAVVAYHQALQEMTRERVPLDWATTQNNLGNALGRLGERKHDTKCLQEAEVAYREALKEKTRERVPLDWAATQSNLGNVLQSLGEYEGGTERLEESVLVYREALKERIRGRVPLKWAATQNNLGTALSSLGEREGGTERLKESVTAYREALKERTRERVPLDWAETQNNLGGALVHLDEHEGGTERLEEAVVVLKSALEVFETAEVEYYISLAKENLRHAQALLETRRTSQKNDK